MKTSLFVLLAALATVVIVRSQNADEENARGLTAEPATQPTTARIIGKIPDGTPPPPSPPKPKFHIASRDILSTATHEQGGRRITIREIKPITLPSPPQPVQASAEVTEEFRQRVAEYRKAHPRSGLMFVGATVYRSDDQPPRTLINLWPEGGGKAIELWSSADMALIAGGISSFEDSAGNTHHLMIAWSTLHIDRLADLFASKGKAYTPPAIPEFPAGKATFKIVGKRQLDAESLTAIQSLHDLYNSEHARLKTAYEGRKAARIERDAYLKAHPPQPKDITLNYWRVENPATGQKGAAR